MFAGAFLVSNSTVLSNNNPSFVPTDFIDRIDRQRELKYHALRSNGFEAGLSFWGDVTVRVRGSSDIYLRDFVDTIMSSVRAEIKRSISISFIGLSSRPILDTANRVAMLTAAHTSLTQACGQYRQSKWFRFCCGEAQRELLEAGWNSALTQIQNSIKGVERPPHIVTWLNQQERIARNIYAALDAIRDRFGKCIFSHEDKQLVEKCRAFAQQIDLDVKDNYRQISYQIGAQNAESLKSECRYLCQAIEQVDNMYIAEQDAKEFRRIFGIDPFVKFATPRDVVDIFKSRLKACISDQGSIDFASFDPVMDELEALIVEQRTFVDNFRGLYHAHEMRFVSSSMYTYFSDLRSNLNNLSEWISSLEEVFMRAEEHRIFYLAEVPYRPHLSFGPSPQKTPSNDPNISIDLWFFGLVHMAIRYKRMLDNDHAYIRELKMRAASEAISTAKDFLSFSLNISTKPIDEHVAKRTLQIMHYNLPQCDFTITQGENSIMVHKLVLMRFQNQMPMFFDRALGGAWEESKLNTLEISDEFVWPAVVEFISWMYGISSTEEVPPFLKRKFIEAANFFMCGSLLPNKLEPVVGISHALRKPFVKALF